MHMQVQVLRDFVHDDSISIESAFRKIILGRWVRSRRRG
jgi:hypothetical protein